MIISRVILRNWRNFLDVDVTLAERVFLVGPNACGKSNFLDVFRFLRDVAKREGGGLQKAINDRGGISKIRCLTARQNPNVEIEVHLVDSIGKEPEWKYAIGIKQESRGHRRSLLEYERVWKGDNLIVKRPTREDKNDPERLTQTYLEQINANKSFRDLAGFFDSILYLHLVPQLLRHPEAFQGTGIQDDPFGINFLERVARTPERTRRSRLQKIESALRLAVPQLSQLTDVKDEAGVPHLEAVYEHWRPRAGRQREDQFSDGTLRLIGLLWSLMESDSLLLLEEPELSLNAGIVSKLPSLMYRVQRKKKRQVMVSTHSADLLSDKGVGLEEVVLMTPGREGTCVDLAASIQEVRALLESGLSVAEAVLPRTEPPGIYQLGLFE